MKDDTKATKGCSSKKRAMFAYGILQLSSTIVSAIALAAIAFSFCSLKREANNFNECVEEIVLTGATKADAVRFCNGG
tara:strand:- start:199 stop:432 length:234 start_codon:yes stop_codon:yes gene_type:complete